MGWLALFFNGAGMDRVRSSVGHIRGIVAISFHHHGYTHLGFYPGERGSGRAAAVDRLTVCLDAWRRLALMLLR